MNLVAENMAKYGSSRPKPLTFRPTNLLNLIKHRSLSIPFVQYAVDKGLKITIIAKLQ